MTETCGLTSLTATRRTGLGDSTMTQSATPCGREERRARVDATLTGDGSARTGTRRAGRLERARSVRRANRDAARAALNDTRITDSAGDAIARALTLAADLAEAWEQSGPEVRRELVGSIMPGGIGVSGDRIIEPRPSPLLSLFSGLNGAKMGGTENGRPRADGRSTEWWALLDAYHIGDPPGTSTHFGS